MPRANKKVAMNIEELVSAVQGMVHAFLKTGKKEDKKYSQLMEEVLGEEFKTKLEEVVHANPPKRVKKLKDPNEPKRPIGSFIMFCMDKREEVKAGNPEMKGTEITTELGRLWKELDEGVKAKYTKKAKKAKDKYDEAMKEYVRPSDEELSELEINQKKERKPRKSGGGGGKKGKKDKDPDAPKHPKTAYMFFAMEKREEVKNEHSEMDAKEVSKELGRMWKEDYAENREKWVEMAKEAKAEYEEAKKAYDEVKGDAKEEAGSGDESDTSKASRVSGASKKKLKVSKDGKDVAVVIGGKKQKEKMVGKKKVEVESEPEESGVESEDE